MEKRDDLYLAHIADAVEKIMEFTKGMTFEEIWKTTNVNLPKLKLLFAEKS